MDLMEDDHDILEGNYSSMILSSGAHEDAEESVSASGEGRGGASRPSFGGASSSRTTTVARNGSGSSGRTAHRSNKSTDSTRRDLRASAKFSPTASSSTPASNSLNTFIASRNHCFTTFALPPARAPAPVPSPCSSQKGLNTDQSSIYENGCSSSASSVHGVTNGSSALFGFPNGIDLTASDAAFESESSPPLELDPTPHNFAEVLKDRKTVRYTGNGKHTYDVGVVRTKQPLSPKKFVGYFEIKILSAADTSMISVGLADPSIAPNKHPGSDPDSYGYRGHDGDKHHDGHISPYGPRFGMGDVVGGVRGQTLHPIVGLHGPSERLSFNFGDEDFLYDINGCIDDEKKANVAQISKVEIPGGVLHSLISNFLLHHGYEDTYKKLNDKAGAVKEG
ncbi:hypothetical protein HK101_001085 [Irineochytrium annulatum]|nr:hypothetical protein HK101_001085 [Irineochytrium annulatum]